MFALEVKSLNLNPDPSRVKSIGVLAHLSPEDREAVLAQPYGKFKPTIKQLKRDVAAARREERAKHRAAEKAEKDRLKAEAKKAKASAGRRA